MWFLFVDDLGHTLSFTTQNTKYVDYDIGLDRVNQSSEDRVHTFSSTTPRLGVESTPNKCVRLYIVPSTSDQGQYLTCLVQYTLSVLAQQVGALPLPELRQTLKCCATTLPMVCHFHHEGCELLTNQGTNDHVLYV